eukprot:CAMPEP_0177202854 /NCGR_PEP_ID=MMETSP0367-20130122/27507_1 /TAXON_ID=447022 ORGANISM="Scrippsiella hangoei-like, Strain SHHI-4" /NCGR_SAMPLE_ID=MMETSP0367 /ASSEMBLY_ACC=CAM_ASM_000362 /LENGTH=241 /DNA_ID=CAMNT_0018651453 /DNA_START=113 /DNA_END=835 /DNA_ORIENTATION=-
MSRYSWEQAQTLKHVVVWLVPHRRFASEHARSHDLIGGGAQVPLPSCVHASDWTSVSELQAQEKIRGIRLQVLAPVHAKRNFVNGRVREVADEVSSLGVADEQAKLQDHSVARAVQLQPQESVASTPLLARRPSPGARFLAGRPVLARHEVQPYVAAAAELKEDDVKAPPQLLFNCLKMLWMHHSAVSGSGGLGRAAPARKTARAASRAEGGDRPGGGLKPFGKKMPGGTRGSAVKRPGGG